MDSLFDRLWIDLNRVDTQIRSGEFDSARDSLQRIISVSRQNGFRWLMARALSIYGSTMRLTPSYREMMTLLAEANPVFMELDAQSARVRPLYYLAACHYGGGNGEEQ